MQCKAKSKRSGQQCKRHVAPGHEVCNMHGGKSLRGAAAPGFKHGRYSRFMPERLLNRYLEGVKDPDLLNLTDEISLMDSRITDILLKVDTGEAGALWQAAKDAFGELQREIRTKEPDKAKVASALAQLDTVLGKGVTSWVAWAEIFKLIEKRRKLVDSETKRRVQAQQTVLVDEVMLFVSALTDSVRRNVTDAKALANISADIGRLIQAGSSGPAAASAPVLGIPAPAGSNPDS